MELMGVRIVKDADEAHAREEQQKMNTSIQSYKDTMTLIKMKMNKTDTLIRQYNDKMKECDVLTDELSSARKEKQDILSKYNISQEKVARIELQNIEYKKSVDKYKDICESQKLKLDGNEKHINQLLFKIKDLEEEKSKLEDDVKTIRQDLKTNKLVTPSKVVEKKSVSLKDESCQTISLQTRNVSTNTNSVKVVPNVEMKHKFVMTDKCNAVEKEPFPILCSKCEEKVTPAPVEQILKIMSFCPTLLCEHLSPPNSPRLIKPMDDICQPAKTNININALNDNEKLDSLSIGDDYSRSLVDINEGTMLSSFMEVDKLERRINKLEKLMKQKKNQKKKQNKGQQQNCCSSKNIKLIVKLPNEEQFFDYRKREKRKVRRLNYNIKKNLKTKKRKNNNTNNWKIENCSEPKKRKSALQGVKKCANKKRKISSQVNEIDLFESPETVISSVTSEMEANCCTSETSLSPSKPFLPQIPVVNLIQKNINISDKLQTQSMNISAPIMESTLVDENSVASQILISENVNKIADNISIRDTTIGKIGNISKEIISNNILSTEAEHKTIDKVSSTEISGTTNKHDSNTLLTEIEAQSKVKKISESIENIPLIEKLPKEINSANVNNFNVKELCKITAEMISIDKLPTETNNTEKMIIKTITDPVKKVIYNDKVIQERETIDIDISNGKEISETSRKKSSCDKLLEETGKKNSQETINEVTNDIFSKRNINNICLSEIKNIEKNKQVVAKNSKEVCKPLSVHTPIEVVSINKLDINESTFTEKSRLSNEASDESCISLDETRECMFLEEMIMRDELQNETTNSKTGNKNNRKENLELNGNNQEVESIDEYSNISSTSFISDVIKENNEQTVNIKIDKNQKQKLIISNDLFDSEPITDQYLSERQNSILGTLPNKFKNVKALIDESSVSTCSSTSIMDHEISPSPSVFSDKDLPETDNTMLNKLNIEYKKLNMLSDDSVDSVKSEDQSEDCPNDNGATEIDETFEPSVNAEAIKQEQVASNSIAQKVAKPLDRKKLLTKIRNLKKISNKSITISKPEPSTSQNTEKTLNSSLVCQTFNSSSTLHRLPNTISRPCATSTPGTASTTKATTNTLLPYIPICQPTKKRIAHTPKSVIDNNNTEQNAKTPKIVRKTNNESMEETTDKLSSIMKAIDKTCKERTEISCNLKQFNPDTMEPVVSLTNTFKKNNSKSNTTIQKALKNKIDRTIANKSPTKNDSTSRSSNNSDEENEIAITEDNIETEVSSDIDFHDDNASFIMESISKENNNEKEEQKTKDSGNNDENTSPVKELRSRQVIINQDNSNEGAEKKPIQKEKQSKQKCPDAIDETNSCLNTTSIIANLNETVFSPTVQHRTFRNPGNSKEMRDKRMYGKEQLTLLMESSEWTQDLHTQVSNNLLDRLDITTIAFVIVEFIVEKVSHDEEFDKTHTPPAPMMTRSEQKLVTLILRINSLHPEFGDIINRGIHHKLFRLGPPQEVQIVETLFRILVVLNKIRKDREIVRIFLCDALYCLNLRAVNIIYVALTCWPEVLPTHESNNDIIVKTIVHVIMTLKVNDPYPKLNSLKNLLSIYYGYPNAGYMTQNFKRELLISLQNNVPGVDTAIILMCKKMGPAWTLENIIEQLKQMIISPAFPSIYEALCLLGNSLRSFSTNDPKNGVDKIIDQLCDVLAMYEELKGADDLQEGVVACLLSISKFNYDKIARSVLKWQSQKELRPSTKDKLTSFLKQHDRHWWWKFIKNNFPQKCINAKTK